MLIEKTERNRSVSLRSSLRSRSVPLTIAWAICMLLVASFEPAAVLPKIQVSFLDSVMINDSIFKLGDIATITGESSGLAENLRNTVVGEAAPAGYSRFVNTADILVYRIQPLFRKAEIVHSGPSRMVVRTDFVEHTIDEFAPEIQAYVQKNVSWEEGCWSAEISNRGISWKSLPGPLEIEVSGLSTPYAKGAVSLALRVRQGSHTMRIPVACRIKVKVSVAVATNLIERGSQVQRSSYELKMMDITNFGPTPYSALELLDDTQAARTIAPGTILHDRLIKAIPIVTKGDQVFIRLAHGTVNVSVPAIAREHGGIGDKIWVENALTHKLIRVSVTGKGSVTALQGGGNT